MIHLLEESTSTNDLTLEAAKGGAPHGSTWIADRQTRGRGRRQIGGERREWFSPPASNIYMSVLLRPDLEPSQAMGLTLATAVAVADAVVQETGLDVWVKWPNDLYIGELKLGGILTEGVTEHGNVEAIVAGLGLNVNVCAEQVPAELEDVMTSLRIESEERWDRMALVLEIRRGILERANDVAEDGLGAVLDKLRHYDRTTGRSVEVMQEGEWVEGVSRGIGDAGQLVVELDGERVDVSTGEARFSLSS